MLSIILYAVLFFIKSKIVRNISAIALSEKYLGLPTMIGSSKNHSFQSLKDRVWKRV